LFAAGVGLLLDDDLRVSGMMVASSTTRITTKMTTIVMIR